MCVDATSFSWPLFILTTSTSCDKNETLKKKRVSGTRFILFSFSVFLQVFVCPFSSSPRHRNRRSRKPDAIRREVKAAVCGSL